MRKLLEKLFPSLLIRRAARYSSQLEEDTGYSIKVVEGEEGLMFFLIDPYGDGYSADFDYWNNLDDLIFDLSDLNSFYPLA